MKISEIFDLNKSQYELDFIDIDIDRDIPLFLDPYFIANINTPWAINANNTIVNFFAYLINQLKENNIEEARNVFSHLGEPNETRLGLSIGPPKGRGIGNKNMEDIFESLLNSRAVETGIVEDLEDMRIFVYGVDKDKASDMVTNIIRKHLIDYTENQCKMWDIPMRDDVSAGFIWNPTFHRWENIYTRMLIIDDEKLLLVPKRIVSRSNVYNTQNYIQHFVLDFLQHEHLRLQSALVKRRKPIGTADEGEPYVTKKSIKDYEGPITKEYLVDFSKNHSDILQKFKDEVKDKLEEIQNNDLCYDDVYELCQELIRILREILPGRDNATSYHRTIYGILELLFFPYLINPITEEVLHEGRKKVDIVFDNSASRGFFHRLHDIDHIPSSYIFFECKNYSNDIGNPELDQLAGRFGTNRGKFGILMCRDFQNIDLFMRRCSDTFYDDRGLIIPLTDTDIINCLENYPLTWSDTWEEILFNRKRNILMRQ